MAHQDRGVKAQGIAEGGEVRHIGASGVVAVLGPVAQAAAPLVQSQDMVLLTNSAREVVPGMGVAPQPVQEHHGRLSNRAPVQVVKVQSVGKTVLSWGWTCVVICPILLVLRSRDYSTPCRGASHKVAGSPVSSGPQIPMRENLYNACRVYQGTSPGGPMVSTREIAYTTMIQTFPGESARGSV